MILNSLAQGGFEQVLRLERVLHYVVGFLRGGDVRVVPW